MNATSAIAPCAGNCPSRFISYQTRAHDGLCISCQLAFDRSRETERRARERWQVEEARRRHAQEDEAAMGDGDEESESEEEEV